MQDISKKIRGSAVLWHRTSQPKTAAVPNPSSSSPSCRPRLELRRPPLLERYCCTHAERPATASVEQADVCSLLEFAAGQQGDQPPGQLLELLSRQPLVIVGRGRVQAASCW